MSWSFLIWFLISALLVGFWVWTSYTLYRQKKAWKAFAEKRKLRYTPNGFYDTPSMSGAIEQYKISFFASDHSELDARSQRRLSAIEINLHTNLSVKGALASGGMVTVVEELEGSKEYRPDIKGWDDSYIIRTDDVNYMRAYLNDERLKKIIGLMNIDKAWVIVVFLPENTLLRLDTPLPLDNPAKVDAVVKQMIDVAKILELQDGEESKLLRDAKRAGDAENQLLIDEDLLDDDIGLQLEDEEAEVDIEINADEKKEK